MHQTRVPQAMWPIIEPRDPDHRVRPREYLREIWRSRDSSQAQSSLLPRESNLCNYQRLTYLLPLSCGTTTSTCSFEELPPLSVQVIVIA